MSLSVGDLQQITQRVPIAQWQFVDITFKAAGVDTIVPHGLGSGTIRYMVVDKSVPGEVFRGNQAATSSYLVLQASAVGTYRLYLILEVSGSNFAVTSPTTGSTGNSSSTPTGAMFMWPTATAPSGYLLLNGASVLRSDFPNLFALIGTTFGSVDSTHFTLPDFRQRFPLGVAAAGTGSTLAGTGGLIDHTHTSAIHQHTTPDLPINLGHSLVANTLALNNVGGSLGFYDGVSFFTYNAGTIAGTLGSSAYGVGASSTGNTTPGATGSNNPPFLAINFIIKT